MADTIVVNEVVDSIVIAVGGEQGPPGVTLFNPEIFLVGDITAHGSTGQNVTTTLANTSVTAGTYGNYTKTLTVTVDSKGRLTSIQENTPLLDASSISTGTLNSVLFPAFSGDVSSNSGSTNLTLNNSGVSAGNYTKVTVDLKGRVIAGINPITLADFGILDAYTKTEVNSIVENVTPTFDTLVGKPNTISGYGIIDALSATQLGVTVATLGSSGKVPTVQLPSYVDAILEFATQSNFPVTGDSANIYIALDTKFSYRWSGSAYINVGQAGGSIAVDFTNIIGKPSTLAGYGILDGVNSSLVGADNGLATLGPNGKLTTSQMPAAVDQIQEVLSFSSLPITGLANVIYLTLDDNKIYRFSGSTYVEISSAGLSDETLKLHTGRTLSLTGDVSWTSPPFDGSANVTAVASLKTSGITAGTYFKLTVNAKGIATVGSNPTTLAGFGITDGVKTSDIGVSVAPLVGGVIPSVNLPSYVDDVLEFSSLSAFPGLGESGKIYIATDTNLSYRWATSTYVQISSAAGVVSVSALNITTNGTDVSSTVANSTTAPTITLNLPTASATKRGALSSTDWSTFNGKQDTLVSGSTLKTINGNSLLGSGDITISGGSSTATPIIFTLTDGELIVEHLSNFTPSIVDGEFIAEYT